VGEFIQVDRMARQSPNWYTVYFLSTDLFILIIRNMC